MVRERGRVDDERLAFPAANGMTLERRCRAVVIGYIEMNSALRRVVVASET